MTPEQKKKAHVRNKRWADKNKEKKAEYRRKHYYENRAKYLRIERERAYKKLYSITIEDYDRMFQEQEGKCAICKSDKSIKGGKSEVFAVDHCHETGEIRGLLCIACNALLGRYEKYKESINNYLE